jgi:hypothetical protein
MKEFLKIQIFKHMFFERKKLKWLSKSYSFETGFIFSISNLELLQSIDKRSLPPIIKTMLERRRRPIEIHRTEQPSMHERGGIGSNGWSIIQRTCSETGSPQRKGYAISVLWNDISDEQFAHRDFLGKREWEDVLRHFPGIEEKQSLAGIVRKTPIDLSTKTDIAVYARLEQTRAPYLIDDFIENKKFPYETQIPSDTPEERITITQYWNGKAWQVKRDTKNAFLEQTDYLVPSDVPIWNSGEIITNEQIRPLEERELAVIQATFLVPDEVDISKVPPEALYENLREITRQDPELVREHLQRMGVEDNPWQTITIPAHWYVNRTAKAIAKDLQQTYSTHFDNVVPFVYYDREQFSLSPTASSSSQKLLQEGSITDKQELPILHRPVILQTPPFLLL